MNLSAKIMVVHMKDIVKKGIFIVIGLGVLAAILVFLFSDKNETGFVPGTYSAEIILHSSPVVIEVTVDESRILDIAMLNMGETQEVFYPLFEPSFEAVREEILQKQTTEIETESGSQVTSSILIDAINSALDEAKKQPPDSAKKSEKTENPTIQKTS